MSGDDIDIVRRMCEGGNGVFHDACLAVCDEVERLRAAGDALVDAVERQQWSTVDVAVAAWREACRG